MHLYLYPYYCSHIRVQVLEVITGKFNNFAAIVLATYYSSGVVSLAGHIRAQTLQNVCRTLPLRK